LHQLISSHAFYPSIGGLERTAELLAEAFAAAGHRVEVVTATPSGDSTWDARQPYRIWRRPSLWRRLWLLAQVDIVHANGASLESALPAVLLGKPLVITHQGYQLVSVDGLGWGSQGPTPLEPSESLAYYRHRLPLLAWLRQVLLLRLRRWVAARAAANVAITQWVASRQVLPRQLVIHNPVALPTSKAFDHPPSGQARRFDCLFLGRLVQEKGLNVLLRALQVLREQHQLQPSLLVVGDGPMRQRWEDLADALDLSSQVRFAGSLRGEALADALGQARIGVVPSVWEEPMGLVAVELLAAGLVPVVSASGGLSECVGEAGLTVPNGDPQALAAAIAVLLHDPARIQALQQQAPSRIAAFAPDHIARRYLALFTRLARSAPAGSASAPG
jgi:glycosyltransferase involved in cell wall biosynthesis